MGDNEPACQISAISEYVFALKSLKIRFRDFFIIFERSAAASGGGGHARNFFRRQMKAVITAVTQNP